MILDKANLDELALFDAAGFPARDGESPEDLRKRVKETLAVQEEFLTQLKENRKAIVFDEIELFHKDLIPEELTSEVEELTDNLYGFKVKHVAGFFLSGTVGLLWGGCLIGDPDTNFSVFLLRNGFKNKKRWLFYNRTELMAHELCHSVRQVLEEHTLEEYFAYQTSPSALRRYLGNCFIKELDAILFIIPALLLFVAELLHTLLWPNMHMIYFWILALLYPAYLFIRNAKARKCVKKAAKKLQSLGFSNVNAVLFRCTRTELEEIGNCKSNLEVEELLNKYRDTQLRWQVTLYRFRPDRIYHDVESI